jgi:hypothetical protein
MAGERTIIYLRICTVVSVSVIIYSLLVLSESLDKIPGQEERTCHDSLSIPAQNDHKSNKGADSKGNKGLY